MAADIIFCLVAATIPTDTSYNGDDLQYYLKFIESLVRSIATAAVDSMGPVPAIMIRITTPNSKFLQVTNYTTMKLFFVALHLFLGQAYNRSPNGRTIVS